MPFAQTVLAEAYQRGMGVIGMKVYAAGALLSGGAHRFTPGEAMGYVLSLPGISTVVIGCSSSAEVDQNAQIARAFQPFDTLALHELERRAGPRAAHYTTYKKPA